MSEKVLYLLDAYALAYRSYFAFIKNPRINSKGENTSAVFGFANTLLEVLQKQKPSHLGVVFDPAGPTFRHEMYPEYKAHREAMPDDMRQSIPFIKQFIEAMNIPVLEVAGFEADDVVGTLAVQAAKQGYTVYMMTPDKDYAQLVTDKIFVFKPGRSGNDSEIWDHQAVIDKFTVAPDKIIDLLGLMGDSSDNIPGCPGVGPKGAEKLISTYGSIDGIYQNLNDLKGKLKENLEQYKDQVYLSRILATIAIDVPIQFDDHNFLMETPDAKKITELFNRLEFKTMLPRVLGNQVTAPAATKQQPSNPVQGSLFDFGAPASAPTQTVQTEEVVETEVTPKAANSIANVAHQYHVAHNDQTIDELLQLLTSQKQVCYDTETTSLEIHDAELVGMSFSFKAHDAWYVPVPENQTEAQNLVNRFKPFFENPAIDKIGQNTKYDVLVLKNYGIEVKGTFYDTMIMHYLVQPELRHNLDALALVYLNYQTITTEELIGKKGKNQLNMRQVDLNLIVDYAAEDADITFQLFPLIKAQLELANMLNLYLTIEAPLIPVLADMEYSGVCINSEQLHQYGIELQQEITRIEKEITDLAGVSFNIASPKQLGEVLFERLNLDDNAKLTGKTKQYSTSEETLSRLVNKHPIINKILDYRGLKKLLSTYVEALPEIVNKKTGRIHTSYNQTIAATGRLSSTNPNLQNIPIRDDRGKEIRKAFVPYNSDSLLLSADYSQIELRLMAHVCGDANMIEAFNQGHDIHAATAARIFKKPISDVTRNERGYAKGANFGIIYGISSFGLAQNLNIGRSEAKTLIDGYFESYPGVKTYMAESIEKAREKGYAETLFGRRRYLPELNGNNAIARGAAERNAINAPIQGTAADIIKLAMIAIHNELKKGGYKTQMMMQVHDELVFNVPKTELEAIKLLVTNGMQNAAKLTVELTAECGAGENWLLAH